MSSGTGFFITLLIASSYGLSSYSDLAKVTALSGLFYLGVDLGANAIFLQMEKGKQSFQNLLSFRLILAFLIFLLVCLIAAFLPYNSQITSGYSPFVKLGIVIFSLSFFTRAVVYSCNAVFQQTFRYKDAAKATTVGSLVTLVVVFLSVFFHAPFMWIIMGYVTGGFLEACIALLLLKKPLRFSLPPLQFSKKLFFATLPLTILLFLNLLYFRIDMIILSLFQKASAVGIYDYAYKYFDFLIALPLFLSNSLYPILLKQENNSRIQRKNISLYTITFFFLGLFLIPFIWLASPLIGFVKQDFTASVLPFQILLLSLPIFFATNILQWIFVTKKRQAFLVWVYALSLLINVVFNFLLIPQYSYVASAAITGFSEAFILLIMIIYLFRAKL